MLSLSTCFSGVGAIRHSPNSLHALSRMTRRRLHRWFIVVAVISCSAIAIISWVVGGALVAPANRAVGSPPDTLPVVATRLVSDSGSNIATWCIRADNSTATIILLHPIRGDRRSMLGRAHLLHEAGYSVVMIDMQAHGESLGDNITIGSLEQHDVKAAVEYVRTTSPTHRVGIVGRSLGGAAALLGSPLNVDAMVLESVYPTITQAINNRIRMRLGLLSSVVSPMR